MATTQTYGNLTAEQKTIYDRALLARLLPNLVFLKYGQKKSHKKREGKTVNFRRFNSLAAATTPLTEGVTPNGNFLDVTAITATVEQYGDFVQISDVLDMVGIDPVITETSEVLGEQAANTLDTLAAQVLASGTNVQYAGGRANTAAITAADKLTSKEIAKVARTLRKAHAKPMEGKYFLGFIDAEQAFDLMQDPLWQDVSKYNGGTAIKEGEVGRIAGVRFIDSGSIKVKDGTSGLKVHCAIIVGKDAYGVVDIDGSEKPEIIVKPAGSAGTADPLNQRSTVGWKAMMAVKILQDLSVLRLETAVSAD